MAQIKSVIITGSTSGIGLDVARRFLAEGAGVVINGRDAAKLAAARQMLGRPERVAAVEGSVADPEVGKRLAEAAADRFGGIDVLVNNAGVFGLKPFLEVDEAELDRYLSINLKGTFFTTQAVAPAMIKAGAGAIINVGTVLVNHGSRDMPVTAPMASKGGIHAFTVSLAAELARHNIRVNTIAPGIIRTPLIGDNADALAGIHPLERIGEVQDTSDAILYLATAHFVTGTLLEVDGGYTHAR